MTFKRETTNQPINENGSLMCEDDDEVRTSQTAWKKNIKDDVRG